MWKNKGPFFTYFHLYFVVYSDFNNDLREVVNMNYASFYCILYWFSITGYILVTFWNEQLDQTPMSR